MVVLVGRLIAIDIAKGTRVCKELEKGTQLRVEHLGVLLELYDPCPGALVGTVKRGLTRVSLCSRSLLGSPESVLQEKSRLSLSPFALQGWKHVGG